MNELGCTRNAEYGGKVFRAVVVDATSAVPRYAKAEIRLLLVCPNDEAAYEVCSAHDGGLR
jgi:hypothetical protein